MIAWRRESEAGRPWATWGLLALTLLMQLGVGSAPDVWQRFGLLPEAPRLAALFGHLFIHPGTFSLLATLFFVATAGPWLEARLGRRLLVASYLAAGLAGAALFAVTEPEAGTPRLGASAAVAGWLGLLTLCARGAPTDLLGVAAGRAGSLIAPGWALAALWLGAQFAAAAGSSAASAAGFGLGALLAMGFLRSGIVTRATPAAAPRAVRSAARRGDARRVPPDAPVALEAQLARAASPTVARAYLAQAASEGRRDSARAVVSERFREALDAKRREPALALWSALVGSGAASSDAPTDKLLELASWARAAGCHAESSAALHAALQGADAAGAAKIARWSNRSDPVVSFRAAERALEGSALGPSDKAALEGLRREAEREAGARGVTLVPANTTPPSPAVGFEPGPSVASPARALALGEAIELAPEPVRESVPLALPDPEQSGAAAFLDAFHAALLPDEAPKPDAERPPRALRVREAVPRAFDAEGLVLEVPGRGSIRLKLSRIHAVTLAGVRGISDRAGDKPVLLVDLCLSAEAEPELQVLRLRSDRFDPRSVAPTPEASPLLALRAFVSGLATAAHAPLLPSADIAGDAPLRIFRDLDSYQREVLGAA